MVPLRGVFEKLGATVAWDYGSRMVTAYKGDKTIKLRIGDSFATVNGSTVSIDAPAMIRQSSTMVPLRFLSETLGADVHWASNIRTVHVNTMATDEQTNRRGETAVRAILPVNTVLEAVLNNKLSSLTSEVGDRFTARLTAPYMGLPTGTLIEGRVDVVRKRNGSTPGVLGIDYDAIKLPDGYRAPINASLIGLDEKSIEHRSDGTIVARRDNQNENLKWVGIGAGAGALIAILTEGNLLTDAIIGAAIGFLYSESQRNATARDVTIDAGTRLGVKLDSELVIR
jgi:hypothetical protein